MNKETFIKVMELINSADQRNNTLYEAGIDSLEYSDAYHEIIHLLGISSMTEEGWDWVEYYLYELPLLKSVDGDESCGNREDGSPIYLRNIEELWNFLEESGYVKS